MNKFLEYFHTDWSAMTGQDWAGTIITVVIFFLLIVVFWYALRPKNKRYLEEQKFTPLNDD